jgi:hypothetical protein
MYDNNDFKNLFNLLVAVGQENKGIGLAIFNGLGWREQRHFVYYLQNLIINGLFEAPFETSSSLEYKYKTFALGGLKIQIRHAKTDFQLWWYVFHKGKNLTEHTDTDNQAICKILDFFLPGADFPSGANCSRWVIDRKNIYTEQLILLQKLQFQFKTA